MQKKILLGLTSTDKNTVDAKVAEIDQLGILQLALFPTCLETSDREDLYKKLEKTKLKRIPHVHLRSDMDEREMDYLIERFDVEVFNIHPEWRAGHFLELKKYQDRIFIENLHEVTDIFWEMVDNSGGVCVDFSHLEDFGVLQRNYGYQVFQNKLKDFKIGCCHVSAIDEKYPLDYIHPMTKITQKHYSHHQMKNLSQMDYMKKYLNYLPQWVSLELENSLTQQLEIKEYLEAMIED